MAILFRLNSNSVAAHLERPATRHSVRLHCKAHDIVWCLHPAVVRVTSPGSPRISHRHCGSDTTCCGHGLRRWRRFRPETRGTVRTHMHDSSLDPCMAHRVIVSGRVQHQFPFLFPIVPRRFDRIIPVCTSCCPCSSNRRADRSHVSFSPLPPQRFVVQ